MKPTSTTTKLRAVFDASAQSSSGASLNDLLLPGPTVYAPLQDILLRFRQHRIGLTADVSKMFRMIELHPKDKDLHRFLWRHADGGNIVDCRMTRLTFGVTSSPFLACQTLHQLAEDHSSAFPQASRVVCNSFYVDDCLSGANSVEEAIHLRNQLNDLMKEPDQEDVII